VNGYKDWIPNTSWKTIFEAYIREKGVFRLIEESCDPEMQLAKYFINAAVEDSLDIIDLVFRYAMGVSKGYDPYFRTQCKIADLTACIAELNGRFREHAVGYEFAGGKIIRVDSRLIHAEVVKPTLALLHGAGTEFKGPLEEFMTAHEYYRQGKDKDAITWALKAFESTLKAISTARGWAFDAQKDTANKLIETVFNNGLIPAYVQGQFTALRSVMESGVPTVRNRAGGHGQGPTPIAIPEHLTRYVMHLAATNILFLIEAHKATP
jgi:AbiJ N-terminal domain 4